MAVDTERSVEMMQRSLRFFAEDMHKAEKASKGVADNVTQLGLQMQHGHRSFMEYVGNAIKLPNIFKEASLALVRQNEEIRTSISNFKDQQTAGKAMLALLRDQITAAKAIGNTAQVQNLQAEKRIYQQLVKEAQAGMNLEEKRLKLKQSIEGVTGKQLAVEFVLLKTFMEAIKRSGEVNDALMQANSLTAVRNDLTRQIYEVQAQTGASFQNMLGAAKALTAVWPKARTDFQSTLSVIVQMEEGLGVSFDNAAQLARVFQINLKTPVREVADQIAVIANSTSLAADEATRFATEIGKAMRLLGPGAAGGAAQVTGYVTALAARMKDVGGDAAEIVKLFTEMNKGTSQAFMLRGIAGVSSPGALRTEGGAQAAMQGIGRMIDHIVTATPGTMAYTAQLEAAAQIIGTTTETIVLYKQALQEANKPLDEHAKLQKRWEEQVTNANRALGRLRESFLALIHQAVLPLIPPLAALFGIMAKVVSAIASSKVAVVTVTIVIGAAIAKTVFSLYKLSAAIIQVAIASETASKFQMLRRGFAAEGIAASGGGWMGKLTTQLPWLGRIGGGIGRLVGFASRLTPPILAVAIAGALGYGIGRLISSISILGFSIDKSLQKYLGVDLYAKVNMRMPGVRTVSEIMSDVRKEALRGNIDQAMKIFEEGKYKVAGLQTERGARGYLESFKRTMAEVREKTGISTVTVDESATLQNDRRMIDLTKKQLENSDEYIKRVREYEQRMNARYEASRAAAEKERMLDEAQYRMNVDSDLYMRPRKSGILIPGHFRP